MWLFHFRIGGEGSDTSLTRAHGAGHAMRCLALIELLEEQFSIKSHVVTSNNDEARAFVESRGVVYHSETELETLLSSKRYQLVVSDVNYLEKEVFDLYQAHSLCACLAPRGPGKYWADIAFKDVLFDDQVPEPGCHNIYSGLQYIVTREVFSRMREQVISGEIKKTPRSIVITMGGVDHANLTSIVVRKLSGLPEDWVLRIIVGGFYPYLTELHRGLKKLNCAVELYRDPSNFYEIVAQSALVITNAGLSAYESIGLGSPPLNIAISPFHMQRAQELEELGLALCLGERSSFDGVKLDSMLKSLWHDQERLTRLKSSGLEAVDGLGAERVVQACLRLLC